jgi:general secretion pathway protein C
LALAAADERAFSAAIAALTRGSTAGTRLAKRELMAGTQGIQHAFSCSALGAIALVAYFQAQGVTHLLAATRPSSTEPRVAQHAQPTKTAPFRAHVSAAAILARNAFDSITGPLRRSSAASALPLVRHDVDPLFAPACSQPRLVIVSEASDPRWSLAAFRASDEARPELHRIGEQVMGQRIEFIGFNPVEHSPAVWLSSPENLCQALLFPHGSAATKADSGTVQSSESLATSTTGVPSTIASKIRKLSETEYEIERSAIDRIIDNQLELTRNVRLVPEAKDGKVIGIRLFGIRPGSLLALLGLQSSDLLESINGYSMASPEDALQAYTQLRRASSLDVRLQRHGASSSLLIHIR